MSLSSLQSYTSEEDLDDNFIGYSEEEQSDHTISSDADFEDPSEVKPEAANLSVLKPDFSELVELCANDLGAGGTSSSAPKIVLCQETPEGTRFFDPREVVGAAALVGALSAGMSFFILFSPSLSFLFLFLLAFLFSYLFFFVFVFFRLCFFLFFCGFSWPLGCSVSCRKECGSLPIDVGYYI
jgi:hypothetical protein